MDWNKELRDMVLCFRVSELHLLLAYAGKSKAGRKTELQGRALELIKNHAPKSLHISSKIKEIYRTIPHIYRQNSAGSSPEGYFGGGGSENDYGPYYPAPSSAPYAGAADNVLQGRPAYTSYGGGSSNSSSINQMSFMSVPICPDVKLKKLPFYDVLVELIKPTTLVSSGPIRMQEGAFPFYLTPQQIADIKSSKEIVRESYSSDEMKIEYKIQVQLRFCLLDSSNEQTDNFPPSICVRVNGSLINLPPTVPSHRPGIEPKRPSKPLNVTDQVKLSASSANSVGVTWVSDGKGREWVMSLYLVKKLTAAELLGRIKLKGARPADFTRGMIKEIVNKDDGDCQIAMTSLKVTVTCPLGKCRMSLPCRASTCTHLQCFDAHLFLQMNERKPTWTCPVCDKPILFENLSIDGYFQEVLNSLSFDCGNEIEVYPDGSWLPLRPVIKQEKADASRPAKKRKLDEDANDTICLDDESEPMPSTSKTLVKQASSASETSASAAPAQKVVDVVDLTLSDSDDEEDIPFRPIHRRPQPIHDETSSTSSSGSESSSSSSSSASSGVEVASGDAASNSTSSVLVEASPLPPQAKRRRDSTSPDVIILDSSPSSPVLEPPRSPSSGMQSSQVSDWIQAVINAAESFQNHAAKQEKPSTSTSSKTSAGSGGGPSNPGPSSSSTLPRQGTTFAESRHSWDFPPDEDDAIDFASLDFLEGLDQTANLLTNQSQADDEAWEDWNDLT